MGDAPMTNERITLLEQLLREAEKYVLRTLEHGRSEGLLHTRGDAENAMLLVQIRNALSGEQGIPANKDDDKVRALSAFHCDFGCDVPAHKPGCPFHKGSSAEPKAPLGPQAEAMLVAILGFIGAGVDELLVRRIWDEARVAALLQNRRAEPRADLLRTRDDPLRCQCNMSDCLACFPENRQAEPKAEPAPCTHDFRPHNEAYERCAKCGDGRRICGCVPGQICGVCLPLSNSCSSD